MSSSPLHPLGKLPESSPYLPRHEWYKSPCKHLFFFLPFSTCFPESASGFRDNKAGNGFNCPIADMYMKLFWVFCSLVYSKYTFKPGPLRLPPGQQVVPSTVVDVTVIDHRMKSSTFTSPAGYLFIATHSVHEHDDDDWRLERRVNSEDTDDNTDPNAYKDEYEGIRKASMAKYMDHISQRDPEKILQRHLEGNRMIGSMGGASLFGKSEGSRAKAQKRLVSEGSLQFEESPHNEFWNKLTKSTWCQLAHRYQLHKNYDYTEMAALPVRYERSVFNPYVVFSIDNALLEMKSSKAASDFLDLKNFGYVNDRGRWNYWQAFRPNSGVNSILLDPSFMRPDKMADHLLPHIKIEDAAKDLKEVKRVRDKLAKSSKVALGLIDPLKQARRYVALQSRSSGIHYETKMSSVKLRAQRTVIDVQAEHDAKIAEIHQRALRRCTALAMPDYIKEWGDRADELINELAAIKESLNDNDNDGNDTKQSIIAIDHAKELRKRAIHINKMMDSLPVVNVFYTPEEREEIIRIKEEYSVRLKVARVQVLEHLMQVMKSDDVPNSVRSISNYLDEHLRKSPDHSFSLPFNYKYKNLTSFGNLMAYMALNLELAFKVYNTHSVIIQVIHGTRMVHSHEISLFPNYFIYGGHSQGKSFVIRILKQLNIEGTIVIKSHVSEKADYRADVQNDSEIVEANEEANAMSLGLDSSQRNGGIHSDRATAFKRTTTAEGSLTYERLERGDSGRGSFGLERVEAILRKSLIMAMNDDAAKLQAPILSRIIPLNANNRDKRSDFTQQEIVITKPTPEMLREQKAMIKRHRRDQGLACMINYMCNTGAFHFTTDVTTSLLTAFIAFSGLKGLETRNAQQIKTLIHSVAETRIIAEFCDYPASIERQKSCREHDTKSFIQQREVKGDRDNNNNDNDDDDEDDIIEQTINAEKKRLADIHEKMFTTTQDFVFAVGAFARQLDPSDNSLFIKSFIELVNEQENAKVNIDMGDGKTLPEAKSDPNYKTLRITMSAEYDIRKSRSHQPPPPPPPQQQTLLNGPPHPPSLQLPQPGPNGMLQTSIMQHYQPSSLSFPRPMNNFETNERNRRLREYTNIRHGIHDNLVNAINEKHGSKLSGSEQSTKASVRNMLQQLITTTFPNPEEKANYLKGLVIKIDEDAGVIEYMLHNNLASDEASTLSGERIRSALKEFLDHQNFPCQRYLLGEVSPNALYCFDTLDRKAKTDKYPKESDRPVLMIMNPRPSMNYDLLHLIKNDDNGLQQTKHRENNNNDRARIPLTMNPDQLAMEIHLDRIVSSRQTILMTRWGEKFKTAYRRMTPEGFEFAHSVIKEGIEAEYPLSVKELHDGYTRRNNGKKEKKKKEDMKERKKEITNGSNNNNNKDDDDNNDKENDSGAGNGNNNNNGGGGGGGGGGMIREDGGRGKIVDKSRIAPVEHKSNMNELTYQALDQFPSSIADCDISTLDDVDKAEEKRIAAEQAQRLADIEEAKRLAEAEEKFKRYENENNPIESNEIPKEKKKKKKKNKKRKLRDGDEIELSDNEMKVIEGEKEAKKRKKKKKKRKNKKNRFIDDGASDEDGDEEDDDDDDEEEVEDPEEFKDFITNEEEENQDNSNSSSSDSFSYAVFDNERDGDEDRKWRKEARRSIKEKIKKRKEKRKQNDDDNNNNNDNQPMNTMPDNSISTPPPPPPPVVQQQQQQTQSTVSNATRRAYEEHLGILPDEPNPIIPIDDLE